jgi:mono/diheme cytochrome c family protein
MRHLLVRRVALTLCGLLVAAALLFAWLVRWPATPPSSASSGPSIAPVEDVRALFDRRCGRCHEAAELSSSLGATSDPPARAREMLAFLREHGQSTDVESRAIVEYLRQGP